MSAEERMYKRNRRNTLLHLKAAMNDNHLSQVLFWAEAYAFWRDQIRRIQNRSRRK